MNNKTKSRHGLARSKRNNARLLKFLLTVFCALFTQLAFADTQTRTPGNISGFGGWIGLGNMFAIDGVCTTTGSGNGYLDGFGFSIPAGSIINGIRVDITGTAADTPHSIQLQKGNQVQGSSFDPGLSGDACPGGAGGAGGATELWGSTWTPDDINYPLFGVAFIPGSAGTFLDGASITVDFTPAPDIALSSTESIDPVLAGSGAGNLTYVVTATNNGSVDARGIALLSSLTFPAGVTRESVTPSGSGILIIAGDTVSWTIDDLAIGTSKTLTFVLTVGAATATGTDTINLSSSVTSVAEGDGVSNNDTTSQATSVTRQVDIQVSKTESIDPVVAGSGVGNLTYVVTVTNAGPSNVTDLVIDEALNSPAGVTVESVTPSVGTFVGNFWTLSLAATESATLTVVMTVPLSAAEGVDVVSNAAGVYSTGGGEALINTGDDSDSESTSIRWPSADWNVIKEYTQGDGGPVEVELACDDNADLAFGDPGNGTTPASLTWSRFVTGGTSCSVIETVPSGYYESARTADCDVSPVVDGGDYACTITNSPTRATFEVTKEFTGGNNPAEVEVSISCNTGLILDQSKLISENESVVFVVTSFNNAELDCDITEAAVPGYTATYIPGGPGSFDADGGCNFQAVEGGTENTCLIVNDADYVDVEIEKLWVFEGSSGDQTDTRYELTLYCDAFIADGRKSCNIGGPDIALGLNGNYLTCKQYYGNGPEVFIASVLPKYPSSHCWVHERIFDDAVEIENGCGNIVIRAGEGDSCVITNTVFFEGIPTLSHHGMALLVLLMLGVGLVSFRRLD